MCWGPLREKKGVAEPSPCLPPRWTVVIDRHISGPLGVYEERTFFFPFLFNFLAQAACTALQLKISLPTEALSFGSVLCEERAWSGLDFGH